MLTFEQIKELLELVASHRLTGLELERSGFRLKIEGEPAAGAGAAFHPAAPAAGLRLSPAAPAAGPAAAGALAAAASPESAAAGPAAPGPDAAASRAEAAAPGPPGSGPAESGTAASPVLPAGAHVVNSPIVGTFYAAPNPDAKPYVRIGDRVEQGQVLCIVEAMKLMNEIESDADGVVLEIYPQNGQPVEYGEPLFAIRPG